MSNSSTSGSGQERGGGNPPKWAWWVIGILVPVIGIAATIWAASAKSDRAERPIASATSGSASTEPTPTPTTEQASPSASSEAPATTTAAPTATETGPEKVFLNTLETVGTSKFFASNVTFRGKGFADSLASEQQGCDGAAEYNLGTHWSKLTFTAGMDDNSYETTGSLTVSADDVVLWTGTVAVGQPRPMTFSVKDKVRLTISYQRHDCSTEDSWISLGNATLVR
ncbi:NPCBM/NEW2 domain-containing protein [Streptomyces sp. NPDC094032]|uniref:NPCBM/NEW2 domain-containing protein n=1 Tax=Streptomyces sp. NPDC094032 TaxID=3155308 RepID=UPI00331C967D